MGTADIRKELMGLYAMGEFHGDTVEIVGASFNADSHYILQLPTYDYIEAEIEWYKLKSRNVNDLARIYGKRVKIWDDIADAEGAINSNYGWCIWSADNDFQYANVLKQLKEDPNTRRAVMIYTRPSMQYEYCATGRNDFLCTNAVQYLIRDDELHVVVQMRSNDAVFGYNNDFAWQRHVQEELCDELGIYAGPITWQVGSLHVYERHFGLLSPGGAN